MIALLDIEWLENEEAIMSVVEATLIRTGIFSREIAMISTRYRSEKGGWYTYPKGEAVPGRIQKALDSFWRSEKWKPK